MKSLVLMLSLAAAPALAQGPTQLPAPPQPVVVTNGEGSVKKAPDRAWVTIAAESRAKTAAEAQRLNTEAMTAVLDKIKGAGIPADAVQTTGYNLQPEFDYANGRQSLRDYVARNQVQVRIDTLAKTGDVIAAAVGTGATNVSNVRFDVKDREGAEREALRLAVRDARGRADAAAAGAAVQLGGVVRIDEQREMEPVIRPVPMAARMAGEAGMAPTVPVEAGEIEIRAHVTLTMSIK
jgi:uncharacterized protein YggE